MRTLRIDLETFSSVDLIKCGVYKYAESDDFEILLFGFAFDDEPIQVIDITKAAQHLRHNALAVLPRVTMHYTIQMLLKELGMRTSKEYVLSSISINIVMPSNGAVPRFWLDI